MTRAWPGWLVLAAVAWFLGAGCGDDSPSDPVMVPDTVRVDLNDGLWEITTSTRRGHHVHDCDPETTVVDTIGLCSLVFLDGNIDPLGISCQAAQDGAMFTFACRLERDLSPCTVTFHTVGSGEYGRETYTLTSVRTSSVSGDPICPDALPTYADPCTLYTIETGVFLEASFDSLRGCTDDSAGAKAYLDRIGLDLGF